MITRELLRRFQQGGCTPDELAMLRDYLENDKQPELEEMLDDDWHGTPLQAGDADARARVKARLRESLNGVEVVVNQNSMWSSVKRYRLPRWQWGIAASVMFLILTGLGYFAWEKQKGYRGNELVTEINNDSEVEKISLEDGSVVWLHPGGKLQYRRSFLPGSRLVSLDGQAFFMVTKDASRPFYVETAKLSVKVLGTSFTVNAYEKGHDAEVSVHSGKVTVSRNGGAGAIILLPNERVSFADTETRAVKKLAEAPVIVDPKITETAFEFAETPVTTVFEMLKNAYKVNIVYDAELVKNCTLTAHLSDQPLFTKLQMICATIGADYYEKNMSIYITVTDGCNEKE